MQNITVKSGGITLSADTKTCRYTVEAGGAVWKHAGPDASVTFNIAGKKTEKLFSEAESITFSEWRDGAGKGIRTRYSGFSELVSDFTVETLAWVDNGGVVRFELIPLCEKDGVFESAIWPGTFDLDGKKSGYAVIPQMQGMIVPDDWDTQIYQHEDGRCNMRDNYMQFIARVADGRGMLGICETPEDGGSRIKHEVGKLCAVVPKWFSSMNGLRYNRVIAFRFMENCDYNIICKVYREYIRKKGLLISLKQKAVKNPLLNKMFGTPVLHTAIWYNIQEDSSYYDKNNPPKNELTNTFDQISARLREIKKNGFDKLYMHLDGWGNLGYDNNHPDVLPPCEKAGGWDGMRRVGETADELGYIFALHDQYRDYYYRADSFDPDETCIAHDGSRHDDATWYGGRQSLLCGTLAPKYLRRNYDEIVRQNTAVRGVYLDVFAIAGIDECFNPRHLMDREHCMKARIECFEYIRSLGMIISSEEPVDYAVPYLDLVHHGPYPIHPKFDKGNAQGIPVPLFNLVYHDCIILPWTMSDNGGWGIPQGDAGWLHALLNGGIPYVSGNETGEARKRADDVCALNARVATDELVKHEFIDGNYRRQRTYFASGAVVEVDFESKTYSVK